MHEKINKITFFYVVQSFVICDNSIAFSNSNPGSSATSFFYNLNKLDELPWDVNRTPNWVEFPDCNRQRNSEFLIYSKVPIIRIWKFVVNNNQLKSELQRKINKIGLDKKVEVDK